MMKKLFAMLLALMLCAGMIPGMVITASASEADAWDGTTASQAWESGSGTETDPYIIMTAEQLARLAADVNEGTSYAEKYFKLGANLDLNGEIQTWIPIGNYQSVFAGHFNGDGKVISNMKAHGPTSNNQKNAYRALFGNASGVIRNFTLENPDSNCYWGYVATAVAYSVGGTVKDITVTNPKVNVGNTGNKDCIGGVIGYIENGTVSNCIVTGGAVTSKFDNTGGIVGLAVDTEISGCKVSDMTIESSSQYTGGIVGQIKYADGTNSITNCTVENSIITGTSAGVGGIVGYGYGKSTGKIIVELCSVTGGNVTASYYAGGIMGQSVYADIIGCCNYGSPVTATSNIGYAGGILGYYNMGNCYSCFSSAVITTPKYPGAIIGRDQSYYYECAYDKTLYPTNLTYMNTKGFTTEEIKAGAAAYYLANTGTRTQNFHDWGQKIGTDLYPVWNTNNDASIVVYREEGPSGYIYYNEGAEDVFEPNAQGYYEISDTDTWYKFARKAEEDHTVNAIVVATIDFSSVIADKIADYRIGDDYGFAGTFNGNGKTVSGLPETSDPLFGTIGSNGKLTGLTVDGITVSGGQHGSKGGLVQTNNGTIENCAISNVTVSGSMGAGLVFENKGTVTGCTAVNVNINTTTASAGLVHSNYGSIVNSKVESGTIKAIQTQQNNSDAWAGGICFITHGGTITGCTNGASVYAESASDLASAAGIVAAPIKNDSNEVVNISNCVNNGNIEANGGGWDYAGGISSIYVTGADAHISLSYNIGMIEADVAAGIIAHINDGSVTNCYNAGPVNARHTAGGISGTVCTITNSHNYGKVTSNYYAAPICATGPDSWPQGRLTNTYGIENNIEAPEKNTYYDTSSGVWAEAVTTGSTREQFESGEIAYLLQQANGNTQVWSQGENYPVFVSDENSVIVKVDFYTVIDGTASTETLATAYVNAGQTLGNKYPASPDSKYIVEGYYSDSSCSIEIDPTTYTTNADTILYAKLVNAHVHSWTYAATGNTLTATCENDGCPSTNKELKISAPALNVYGGAENKYASLSATSIGGITTLPAIQYEQKNGESWTVLSGAPDVPGSYCASITVDMATASVEYTIDQATLTASGTGVASGIYGAKLSELTVSGLTALLNGTEVPGTWTLTGDDVPNVGDTESYTAIFTPGANAAYYKPLTAQVTLNITPAQYAAPTAVEGSYAPNVNKTAFVYTIAEPTDGAYEYSTNGTDWQDSPIFAGFNASDFDGFNAGDKAIFYARVKADPNHTASDSVHTDEVEFTKLDQAAPALSYQVSGNSGNRTITIAQVEGAEYSFDGGNTWGSSNVKNGINDETVSIAIRMKETAVYKASEEVSASVNTAKQVQTVTFDTTDRTATYGDGTLEARAASAEGAITYESSDTTVATVDDKGVVTIVGAGTATITAKAAETETHAAAQASYSLTVNPKALTAESIILTLTENLYQYDGTAKTPAILLKDGNTVLEADKDYQVKNGSTTTASAIAVYTITLSGKGNYTGDISEEWEITKIAAPAAPQNLQGIAPTTGLVNDGKIIGTTDEMEYATKADFSDAKDCGEGETTNLAPGTYYVRLKGTDTTEPGAAAVVNVPAYSAPVITFDANGGTVAIASVTTEQDGTLAELPTATRGGYTFDGWFTAKTGGTQVTADTFFSVSTTIYAQWTYIPVPPVIDSPAADTIVEVYEGQTAQMTVVSQNATSYQWFINRNDGAGFVEYDGSTLATHTTAAVKPENDGFRYYCLVTNADGSVRSHVFTLKVLEQIDLPQTGDNSHVGVWMAMCLLSMVGILLLRKKPCSR